MNKFYAIVGFKTDDFHNKGKDKKFYTKGLFFVTFFLKEEKNKWEHNCIIIRLEETGFKQIHTASWEKLKKKNYLEARKKIAKLYKFQIFPRKKEDKDNEPKPKVIKNTNNLINVLNSSSQTFLTTSTILNGTHETNYSDKKYNLKIIYIFDKNNKTINFASLPKSLKEVIENYWGLESNE